MDIVFHSYFTKKNILKRDLGPLQLHRFLLLIMMKLGVHYNSFFLLIYEFKTFLKHRIILLLNQQYGVTTGKIYILQTTF